MDDIKYRKTGKIGIVTIVTKVYEEIDLIHYHLIGTQNCIHIFSTRDERFDIIKGEQMQFKLIVILLTFIVYSMIHAEDKIQEIKLHDSNYLEVFITETNVVGVEFDGSRMKLISNINNLNIYIEVLMN
jgi:hypothetical protein